MRFEEIFRQFLERRKSLKVLFVASSNTDGQPNAAPKMLVDVALPNRIIFLDYKFTCTYANILKNSRISVSFMDDENFIGYRLSGTGRLVGPGADFDAAAGIWHERVIAYEAERIVERLRGGSSARQAENALPENFVFIELTVREGSMVEPRRVLRALCSEGN